MSDKLKPYPKYKDSGVPWLGKIPDHWDVRRCKYVFREIDKRSLAGTETHLSMSQKLGLIPSSKLDGKRLQSESYAGGKLCEVNDLVLNRLKAHLGVFAIAKQAGVISPDYTVLRPIDNKSVNYFEYLLKTPDCVAELRRSTKGVVEGFWRLYTDDFYRIAVPIPPPDEQATIVRFLDANAVLVRQFIRNRRRLIEVLTEQKQAIINRAVTRGLDPNVKMKPSCVGWLGDVPEHWDVRRCKYIFREIDQRSESGTETHLSMSQRFGLIPSDDADRKHLRSESYAGGKLCEPNDLVLNRLKAHLGVFAKSNQCGVISPDYTVLRPNDPEDTSYYQRLFKTPPCIAELRRSTKGIVEGFWRLYTDDFYNISVPVPSKSDRQQILAWLSGATHELDTAIDVAFREIEYIREYRNRQISDVACGLFNVQTIDLNDNTFEVDELDDLDDDLISEEDLDEEVVHADD